MTLRFLDTSSLVKLFVEEAFSERLRSNLESFEDYTKAISPITQVEVCSALQRRLRNREVIQTEVDAAYDGLRLLASTWVRVPLSEQVVELASGVVARHALRSLDALQLASALSLRSELRPGDDLLFIACDQRLLAAAAAEGVATWNLLEAPPSSAAPTVPVN